MNNAPQDIFCVIKKRLVELLCSRSLAAYNQLDYDNHSSSTALTNQIDKVLL